MRRGEVEAQVLGLGTSLLGTESGRGNKRNVDMAILVGNEFSYYGSEWQKPAIPKEHLEIDKAGKWRAVVGENVQEWLGNSKADFPYKGWRGAT